MINIEDIFKIKPYSLKRKEKGKLLVDYLNYLNKYHIERCEPYGKIHSALKTYNKSFKKIEGFPFLPVRLFKNYELKSINSGDVTKILTSSGTTSQKVSKIFLDRTTSLYQTKALVNIMQDIIGKKRLPMIIVDTDSVFDDRSSFSARGAGILGMANFGRDHFYLLGKDMKINFDGLENFLSRFGKEEIFIFGFTFLIWQYLYKGLSGRLKKKDFSNSILIHGGGWKKLAGLDNNSFKETLNNEFGIKRIFNFYGMAEQVGSIFMECEHGNLHTPVYADIIIRDSHDWSCMEFDREGIIEVLSILPHSYPGHILLTEDIGKILGEDDCACGRKGKYFSVKGRVPETEIRGCSDVFAYESF